MRHRGAAAVAGLAVALIAVPSAQAAATRAEYVAQVDPICQSYQSPLDNGFISFHRNFKRMNRAVKKGNAKAFVNAARRTARTLRNMSQLHTNLAAQIAGVPPAPGDEGPVSAWLDGLRRESASEGGAANALLRLRIGSFFKKLRQSDQGQAAGKGAIAGFGFQTCGDEVV